MNRWEEDDTFLSRWLNDELSADEKAEFENSAEGKEYVSMIRAAENIKAPSYDTRGELAKLKARINTAEQAETKVIWMRPAFRMAVAAAVVVIAVVAYLAQPSLTTIKTSFGEQEIAFLPDGSEVRLNSSSSISYDPDTWNESREIELKGEAFFEVKRGSDFVVNTTGGSVKVLGTSFNVKSRGKLLDVVCFTGKVNVNSTNVDEDITPGMAIRVRSGQLDKLITKEVESGPSWIDGITNLEDVPLGEALMELENVFGLDVQYDQALDSLIINAAFPNDSIESALELVLETLDLRYTFDKNTKRLEIQGVN